MATQSNIWSSVLWKVTHSFMKTVLSLNRPVISGSYHWHGASCVVGLKGEACPGRGPVGTPGLWPHFSTSGTSSVLFAEKQNDIKKTCRGTGVSEHGAGTLKKIASSKKPLLFVHIFYLDLCWPTDEGFSCTVPWLRLTRLKHRTREKKTQAEWLWLN